MATKARTKSAKRRAKRGRPTMDPQEREPNGRPSRRKASVKARETETVREIQSVAREARVRVHGIPESLSERKEAGYVLGRLYLAGWIKKCHLEAGDRMATDYARYYGLTGIPFPSPRTGYLFATKPEPREDHMDVPPASAMTEDERGQAARAAANKVMAIEGVLGGVDVSGRPVTTSVKRACLLDTDEGLYLRHMLRHLVRGLECLVDYYGIEREKALDQQKQISHISS